MTHLWHTTVMQHRCHMLEQTDEPNLRELAGGVLSEGGVERAQQLVGLDQGYLHLGWGRGSWDGWDVGPGQAGLHAGSRAGDGQAGRRLPWVPGVRPRRVLQQHVTGNLLTRMSRARPGSIFRRSRLTKSAGRQAAAGREEHGRRGQAATAAARVAAAATGARLRGA